MLRHPESIALSQLRLAITAGKVKASREVEIISLNIQERGGDLSIYIRSIERANRLHPPSPKNNRADK